MVKDLIITLLIVVGLGLFAWWIDLPRASEAAVDDIPSAAATRPDKEPAPRRHSKD